MENILSINDEKITCMSQSFAQEHVFQKHNTTCKITEINMDSSIKQLLEIVQEDFERTYR